MESAESREERRLTFNSVRCKSRSLIQDSTRGIDPSSVITNEAEMAKQAKKLMKKPTAELLLLIKNSLLLGTNFVHAFLKVQGALEKLLRFFYAPGTDPKIQILASHCLVNVCLCSKEDSQRVTKTAGPFLVMQLEGTSLINSSMAADSAMAVGNLSCHPEAAALLKEQGAYLRVTKLLLSDSEPLSSSAVYCLTQAVYNCQHLFSSEELIAMVENCLQIRTDDPKVWFLLSLFSNHPAVIQIFKANALPPKALVNLGNILQKNCNSKEERTRIIAIIRIVANSVSEPSGEIAGCVLSLPNIFEILTHLPKAINLSDAPYLVKETLWFMANLLNHTNAEVRAFSRNTDLPSIFMQYAGILQPNLLSDAAATNVQL